MFRHIQAGAPLPLHAACGIQRTNHAFRALKPPKRVVVLRSNINPPFFNSPDKLLLPLRIILEKCIRFLSHGEVVPVAILERLAVRARHLIEVCSHHIGIGAAGLLFIKAPRVVGAGVVRDVNRPRRRILACLACRRHDAQQQGQQRPHMAHRGCIVHNRPPKRDFYNHSHPRWAETFDLACR